MDTMTWCLIKPTIMSNGRSHTIVVKMLRDQLGVCYYYIFLFMVFIMYLGNHRSLAWTTVDGRGRNRNIDAGFTRGKRSTATVEATLRCAIQLSNVMVNNITAAHEACQYWSDILDDEHSVFRTSQKYDDAVIALSLALYASCLVRVGQDAAAVGIYIKALAMDPTNNQVRLAKAQALQRLLQYQHARHEFQQVASLEGILGVATCCLRLGDWRSAIQALSSSRPSDGKQSKKIQGLLGTLQYLETGSIDQGGARELIQAAAREEPLYRWIQGVLLPDSEHDNNLESANPLDSFLSLITINTCPLDDPTLVRLDDKVWLHRLLIQQPDRTIDFWPLGYVVADATQCGDKNATINLNLEDSPESLYFLKERSGYGSHGNTLLTTSEAENCFREVQESNVDDEKLLQRMVEPILLLDGRKFSLRIYVVYFSTSEVYLSPHGLVKLASMRMGQEVEKTSVDPRFHMTNSGRDVSMEQHDLSYLRDHISKGNASFESFWKRITIAVEHVVDCFQHERLAKQQQSEWESRREELGIPKIMGFDFVVDASWNPWLVEINRFPGLEPRDNSDLAVKQQVVHDAWSCAAERVSTKIKLSFGHSSTQHSLQKLNVERLDSPRSR